ncbi:MAG: biosynthetic peptidoglycan transglycosylase [Clostridia bacterium]|nr:biosynthetic peptidoglycan transglycosylase [Clostridia bacterium]
MKWIKRLVLLLILIVCGIGAVVTWQGYRQYQNALAQLPLEEAVEDLRTQQHFVTADQIPDVYRKAVVAVEDRRFYQHKGFDIIGTARAIFTDLKEKKLLQGGSTLTQQLSKNMYFPMDDTPQRKAAEIFMALDMERKYSKQEILELYVNGIYYGSGYYNLYDASVGYFGKEPWDMTDEECTLLAGIPNAPSVYSLDVNPDLARQRQAQVVSAMVDCGYLLQSQAEELLENR